MQIVDVRHYPEWTVPMVTVWDRDECETVALIQCVAQSHVMLKSRTGDSPESAKLQGVDPGLVRSPPVAHRKKHSFLVEQTCDVRIYYS